jgi:hypothetical protein
MLEGLPPLIDSLAEAFRVPSGSERGRSRLFKTILVALNNFLPTAFLWS